MPRADILENPPSFTQEQLDWVDAMTAAFQHRHLDTASPNSLTLEVVHWNTAQRRAMLDLRSAMTVANERNNLGGER